MHGLFASGMLAVVATLRQLLSRATRTGAERAPNAWDARRVVMVNGVGLLTILLSWVSLPAAFLDQRPEAIPLNFAMQAMVAGVLLLNRSGRPAFAAGTLCFASVAAISGQVYLLGPDSGVHFWYVPVILLPLYIFPSRFTASAIAYATLVFLLFTVIDVRFELSRGGTFSLAWAQVLAVLAVLAIGVYARSSALGVERRVEEERARADDLLRNMLPSPIATRLLAGERPADRHDDVTVLFADIVNFTALAETQPADRVLAVLDRIFSAFDDLVVAHGLEKIKTVGDAYMVAGGAPSPLPDHAAAAATLALAMQSTLARLELDEKLGLELRIGLHCGPVVAGVIGRQRYAYDLWSDVVNVAARMEQHGLPGTIQVTEAVAVRLSSRFLLAPRGQIEIKGKGSMRTWLLVGPRNPRPPNEQEPP